MEKSLNIPNEGIALCLSGGGFRAALFHIGALWRLNEFGYLPKLDRISSVSGGSIVSAWLGVSWKKLTFNDEGRATNFVDTIVNPLRAFAGQNLDVWIILGGMFNPFRSVGENLIRAYRKALFGTATLQDLPDRPQFVINASNAQTGVLFRFSKAYNADYRLGMIKNPNTELAVAVAASSAFPPFLSPVILTPENHKYSFAAETAGDLRDAAFTSKIVLMDGGVYDNLGLESAYKRYETVLVSDGGGKMQPDPKPKLFWGVQAFRVLNMMDNQVRALRKQEIIDLFLLRQTLTERMQENPQSDEELVKHLSRKGTYWGTYTNIKHYGLGDAALDCPHEKTVALANLPTRLWKFSAPHQEALINWGYAVCDAAMRRHVDSSLPNNARFPYPIGVG